MEKFKINSEDGIIEVLKYDVDEYKRQYPTRKIVMFTFKSFDDKGFKDLKKVFEGEFTEIFCDCCGNEIVKGTLYFIPDFGRVFCPKCYGRYFGEKEKIE